MYGMNEKSAPARSYAVWEASVTEQVAELLGVDYSDAAGVIEAQQFLLSQAWGNGLESEQAANLIADSGENEHG